MTTGAEVQNLLAHLNRFVHIEDIPSSQFDLSRWKKRSELDFSCFKTASHGTLYTYNSLLGRFPPLIEVSTVFPAFMTHRVTGKNAIEGTYGTMHHARLTEWMRQGTKQ